MVANGRAGGPRAALAFILVTVFIDVLSFGLIIPVLPRLIVDLSGGDTARAAKVFGLFGTVWALMQFVASPIIGSLSDKVGRRPVILLSCLGLGLDFVFMALAPTLAWLFVGRMISGVTAATIATAGAYIADVSPPGKRAANFGMIGAAWGAGFIVGPAIGGLLGQANPRLPFWAAAALALIGVAYGFFVLPESLPRERRAPFSWKKANPVGALTLLRSHHELFGLATVNSIYLLAHHVLPSVWVLYTSYRYGWSTGMTGLALAGVGLGSILVQVLVVRRAVAALGERITLLVGLSFGAAGFAIWGLAPDTRMFWVGLPVFSLMGLVGPSVQALMTARVQPNEQGQLQGANSSIMGLTGLVGPGLFTLTFAYFIDSGIRWHVPGAPFLLAAGLMIVALAVAWSVRRNSLSHRIPVLD
ncbi:MAG: TCR/Tet family MFS transporter [Gemmatimonadaceae bacterium]